jgi:type I restriction-modification system DNA methylase subunit
MSTNVLNKFNPTHGGAYKQIMHMVYQGSGKGLFASTFTHGGVQFRKGFRKQFL